MHLGIPFYAEIYDSFVVIEFCVMYHDNALSAFQCRKLKVVLRNLRTFALAVVWLHGSVFAFLSAYLVVVLVVSAG